MTRITRTAGYALALAFLSLSAFSAANAQTPPNKYGFCYGLAGNPRVDNFTRTFVLGPSTPPSWGFSFLNHLTTLYGGATTQENACPMFATAAEAEARRRKLLEIAPGNTGYPNFEIDWIPQGATALSEEAPTQL